MPGNLIHQQPAHCHTTGFGESSKNATVHRLPAGAECIPGKDPELSDLGVHSLVPVECC